MLVSIIPAPSKYGPRDNITVAEQRRKITLKEMEGLVREDQPPGPDGKLVPMLTEAEWTQQRSLFLWYAGYGDPHFGAVVGKHFSGVRR